MAEPGMGHLFTTDNLTAIGLATVSSLVAAMQSNVRGWGVLVNNVAAATLMAVVLPIAQNKGYGWGDYLGLVCVITGVFSGVFFLIVAKVAQRILMRTNEISDGWIDKFIKPKGPPNV